MLYYILFGIWLIMVFGFAVIFAAEAMDDWQNDRPFHYGFHMVGTVLLIAIGLYLLFLEI